MRIKKWIITSFSALTFFTLMGLTNQQVEAATYNSVRITGSVVNVRTGTSTKYKVIAKVKRGQTFKVYAKKNGWLQISVNGKKGWVTSQYTSSASSQGSSASNRTSRSASRTGAAAVAFAKDQLGKKYVWGAEGPNAFDCSGFTTYVMKNVGVSLSRTSAAQASNGVEVSRSQLEQGDLIFFHTTRAGIGHVGIYIGGERFIHASSAAGKVIISSISSGYYNERFVTARRVIR